MPLSGYLSYDVNRSLFVVEDKTDSLSSKFSMSNEGCVMKGDGKLNFGLDLGQVELSTFGNLITMPLIILLNLTVCYP